jgi:hypothetical protein
MKKWLETVKDWPAICAKREYCVKIVKLKKKRKRFEVTIEFIDQKQAGRRKLVVLERPTLPAGLTAAFFAACGQNIQAGNQFSPEDYLGQTITVRFGKQNDNWEAIDFGIRKNKENGSDGSHK